MMKTVSLVTDKPDLVGRLDGVSAAVTREPKNRVEQLPDNQKEAYQDGFRRGAKYGAREE
jgi:hypothetical protein